MQNSHQSYLCHSTIVCLSRGYLLYCYLDPPLKLVPHKATCSVQLIYDLLFLFPPLLELKLNSFVGMLDLSSLLLFMHFTVCLLLIRFGWAEWIEWWTRKSTICFFMQYHLEPFRFHTSDYWLWFTSLVSLVDFKETALIN